MFQSFTPPLREDGETMRNLRSLIEAHELMYPLDSIDRKTLRVFPLSSRSGGVRDLYDFQDTLLKSSKEGVWYHVEVDEYERQGIIQPRALLGYVDGSCVPEEVNTSLLFRRLGGEGLEISAFQPPYSYIYGFEEQTSEAFQRSLSCYTSLIAQMPGVALLKDDRRAQRQFGNAYQQWLSHHHLGGDRLVTHHSYHHRQ